MKVFVIGSDVPSARDDQPGVTAVNIVFYELLQSLRRLGHEISLQFIFNEFRQEPALKSWEIEAIGALGNEIHVFEPVFSSAFRKPSRSLLRRLLDFLRRTMRPRVSDFYPAVALGETISARLASARSDVILTVWSPEGIAATHHYTTVPRIAYHGDVDFQPAEARVRNRAIFGDNSRRPFRSLHQRMYIAQHRSAHWRLMKRVDVIANVTACNARYYERRGHQRSIYVRNIWAERASTPLPPQAPAAKVKIIGHVGYLDRTGSTFGLHLLLQDVVPNLPSLMGHIDYQIHIIGGGQPVPSLRSLLDQPHVVRAGYVPDLEGELRSSDVVLLLNNAGSYRAAYTRHLVAWSMRLCLIVHANSVDAIPEIRHMENALVGSTGQEIAELIRRAVTDRELNERIRKGGRHTYEQFFTPDRVAETLNAEMEQLTGDAASVVTSGRLREMGVNA